MKKSSINGKKRKSQSFLKNEYAERLDKAFGKNTYQRLIPCKVPADYLQVRRGSQKYIKEQLSRQHHNILLGSAVDLQILEVSEPLFFRASCDDF